LKVFIADGSTSILERLDSLLSEIPGIEIAGHAKDAGDSCRCAR
jgi:hypothetical protein